VEKGLVRHLGRAIPFRLLLWVILLFFGEPKFRLVADLSSEALQRKKAEKALNRHR
jgi:hypothetical protein